METKQTFNCSICNKDYVRADFYHKHMEDKHPDKADEALNDIVKSFEVKKEEVEDYIQKGIIDELKKTYKVVFSNKYKKIIKKKYNFFICNDCGRKLDSKVMADKHNCK